MSKVHCSSESCFSIICYCRTCLPLPLAEATTRSQAWKAALHRFNRFLSNGGMIIIHCSFTATCRVSSWDIRSTVCRFRIMYSCWFHFFLFNFRSVLSITLVFSDTFTKKIQQLFLLCCWRWFRNRTRLRRSGFIEKNVVHRSAATRWGKLWMKTKK